MERLRRFGRRLLRSNEKVIFAVMVAILIWRVVQIVWPDLFPLHWPPWEPVRKDGPELAEILPVDIPEPGRFNSSQIDMTRFASVTDDRWQLPGGNVINTEEEKDPGLPEIHLQEIRDVGGKPWAVISVDGGRAQLVKPNSYFADRRALLEEVDTQGKKIVFTWLQTNKKYERALRG